MKKAVFSSLLSVSALMLAPGAISHHSDAFGQAAATAATGQVQLDPAEFADYDNAVNKQTTPQTQAPALEAYLAKYPKSTVKADVLQRLMIAYSQLPTEHAKAIETADKVLQLQPNNPQAYVIEVAYRTEAAQAITDPTARQAGLDAAADYAQKGLDATKPDAMSAADFTTLKASITPTFYSAIGSAALNKKDSAAAIAAYKAELAATKLEDTQKAGTALQDTFYLGEAYQQSTPPDYVNCTFYTTRAAVYAPDNFKAQLQPLATYCYKKYHGGVDGYDAVIAAAKANLNPPAGFTITAAPSDADIAEKTIAETPNLATLALADKEFILQNGKPEDAEKVFDTIKGKTTEIPGATVLMATADQLQVAVSDDAVQSKKADFTYNMKTPLKTIPVVGSKINLTGTYTSYTQTPLMIIMSDGEEVAAKRTAAKAPVHHGGGRHR